MTAVEPDQKVLENAFVRDDFYCFVSSTQAVTVGVDANDNPVVGVVSGMCLVKV